MLVFSTTAEAVLRLQIVSNQESVLSELSLPSNPRQNSYTGCIYPKLVSQAVMLYLFSFYMENLMKNKIQNGQCYTLMGAVWVNSKVLK